MELSKSSVGRVGITWRKECIEWLGKRRKISLLISCKILINGRGCSDEFDGSAQRLPVRKSEIIVRERE